MNFLRLTIIVVAVIVLYGCDTTISPLPDNENDPMFEFGELDYGPEIVYYGAHLEYFPPKVRDWIINIAFTKDKMEQPYMTDSKLKIWWSDDNNSVLFEASYIVAAGYGGAGTLKIWGQNACYSGSSSIFDTYGEYAKYKTLRFEYELKLDTERLLKNDPAYAEIIFYAKELCHEIEYDWANFDAYKGPVKPNPDKKHFVCDGYANEVMNRLIESNYIQAVQKWTSPGHVWNIIKLVDGRILYFDLTWFDNEHINEETGDIYQTDDYDWENITFYRDLFLHSNIGYSIELFHHDIGKFTDEVIKN